MKSKVLSVAQLNEYIKGVFEDELILHHITVSGEIYEISVQKNNTFVTITDDGSYLSCVHFGAYEKLNVGTKVHVHGSVSYSQKSGKVSFIFKSMKPVGEGAIYAEFLAVKNRLQQEGLFNKQLPLPNLIQKMAIITSLGGAVIHDFITTVFAQHKLGKIDIYPVSVQGESAQSEVIGAIDKVSSFKSYDVLVIARGGGSAMDLNTFNTEAVAKKVAQCNVPVISAVGHETDYTLCDFCASYRAGTPSIAGEMIAAVNARFVQNMMESIQKLGLDASRWLEKIEERVSTLAMMVAHKADIKFALTTKSLFYTVLQLKTVLEHKFQNIDFSIRNSAVKLNEKSLQLLGQKENELANMSADLDRNSPLKILAQGYAKIFKGIYPVDSVNQLNEGDQFSVNFKDGLIDATAKNKKLYANQNNSKN